MTWLQILALAGVIGTFLGIGLALGAYFNGKHIKAGVSQISELLIGMEQRGEKRHKETVDIVTKQHKDVVELLKKGFGEISNK